jgi:hypothetical protein
MVTPIYHRRSIDLSTNVNYAVSVGRLNFSALRPFFNRLTPSRQLGE